ncbi:hypothetical protein DFH08DRAFT_835209 [Mycena albidolilacea]|uniref:Uncharacterized protein n=1 Tax=Mycena albidolilacea TaxID=1033008 RepID=A0AAD7ARM6_9AGAR|nr:hypothetical protein DFH08DRAFT_835209 [Mycena albidolilacea]
MDHDELPRISLPSMRVWLRIKADFAQQVHAKAEQHAKYLPPARREQLLQAAQQYVDQWSTIAQANIRINGRDFDSLQPHEQDAEPFDEALDRKIWALAGSRLEWHRKIAQERREKPISLEHTLQELVKEHESLDADLDMEEPSLPDEDDDGLQVDVDDAVMGQIFAVAGELAQILPTQRERSERSRAVEAEYKALKP